LRDGVADKLDDDWSPQQIAQWLRREFGGDAWIADVPRIDLS
jgi:IS30 family transposase